MFIRGKLRSIFYFGFRGPVGFKGVFLGLFVFLQESDIFHMRIIMIFNCFSVVNSEFDHPTTNTLFFAILLCCFSAENPGGRSEKKERGAPSGPFQTVTLATLALLPQSVSDFERQTSQQLSWIPQTLDGSLCTYPDPIIRMSVLVFSQRPVLVHFA